MKLITEKIKPLQGLQPLKGSISLSSAVLELVERSLSRELLKQASLTFLFISLLFSHSVAVEQQTQQQKNDSLLTIYNNKSENDSVRLDAFYKYVISFRKTDPDKSIILANELAEKAETQTVDSYKKHFESLSNSLKGFVYTDLSNFEKAEFHFQQFMEIQKLLNNNYEIMNAYQNLGWHYSIVRKYDLAEQWFLKAKTIAEKINHTEKRKIINQSLAVCYNKKMDYHKAINYLKENVKIYENEQNDLKQAELYNLIANAYGRLGEKEEMIETYFRAHDIYESIGEDSLAILSIYYIGNQHRNMTEYPTAINYLKIARDKFIEHGFEYVLAWAYNELGICYTFLGNYPLALENCLMAKKIVTGLNNKRGLAVILNSLGSVYFYLADYESAYNIYKQNFEINKELKNKSNQSDALNNMGLAVKLLDRPQEAKKLFEEALVIRKEIDYKYGICSTSQNLGSLYLNDNEHEKAYKLFLESRDISITIGAREREVIADMYISEYFKKIGNYDKAIEWTTRGYALAKEKKMLKQETDGSKFLAELYSLKKNYQKAYKYQQEYYELKDSLFNEEKTKELTRLEMNYVFEQEQDSLAAVQRELDLKNEAKLQKAEATRNYSIGGFGAAAILAFLMYSRFNVSRKKNKIIQAEKERSEELLLNILPEETAIELKEKGVVQAQHHDEVTVLFADITNFTQLSERTPPQELVATIHTYFSAFDQIMEKHGIEKIKTIGDAYMAASGLHGTPLQAKRMIHAAQEMMAYVQEHPLSEDINFRVGIHTGPVVSGVVGVKKFAYDIWGDTVNTAARMESASEPGKINISEATQQKIKDYFEHTSRGKVAIKGKGEMEMFFVNS